MENKEVKIGEKIKLVRELRGFKQELMAAELKISQNGYSKIERGETDVSFSRLEQIAKILSITIPDLINLNQERLNYSIINNNSQITTQASVFYHNNNSQITTQASVFYQNENIINVLMEKVLKLEMQLHHLENKFKE